MTQPHPNKRPSPISFNAGRLKRIAMRLWSLHPKYLDPQGLVAPWREALLAQAVLRGETRGYRAHPQLQRFREQPAFLAAIGAYLLAVPPAPAFR